MQTNPINPGEWSERFAVLVFGGLQLLIPQSDIYSLESTVDITSATHIGSIGQITQSSQVWSLYALSPELSLLSSCPETYRVVILMKNIQPVYGLLCEQVSTIARSEVSIHPVPTVMHNQDSPLLALALIGEEVRYISSAAALNRLFPR